MQCNEPQFLGPRLTDKVLQLINDSGMSDREARARYNLGITWLGDLRAGRTMSPRADLLQRIYEDLTGEPLIKE